MFWWRRSRSSRWRLVRLHSLPAQAPCRASRQSPRILGGQTFEITKGDLIIVPRGTPHQRINVAGKEFSMILIKIFAEPRPAAMQQPSTPRPKSKGQKP